MCACVFRVEGSTCQPDVHDSLLYASHVLINQGGEVLIFLSFVTGFLLIRLHMSRQNNNTQKLDTVVARKVKPCKIALTEPEGKTVILRSPYTPPPPPALACLHRGGIILPRPPPSYDESPALRRLASPTSICGRLDPLITMPATSHH